MTTTNETLKLETETKYGHRHAYVEMFFNSQLISIDIAENGDWFRSPKTEPKENDKTYQLWGAAAMITADGQGMAKTLRCNQLALTIETEFGSFLLRPVRENDKKVYGVNNYRGLFLEKLAN